MYSTLGECWSGPSNSHVIETYGYGSESIVRKGQKEGKNVSLVKQFSRNPTKPIIVNNPKVGSRSIRANKEINRDFHVPEGHSPSENLKEIVFLRNPISRFRSAIEYEYPRRDYLKKYSTFVEMIEDMGIEELKKKLMDNEITFDFQKNWVGDNSIIFCLERGIENELRKINPFHTYELKHKNQGEDKGLPQYYWWGSEELLLGIVNKYYLEDLLMYEKNCSDVL